MCASQNPPSELAPDPLRPCASQRTQGLVADRAKSGVSISSVYEGITTGDSLGDGMTGTVRLITDRKTGAKYACKALELVRIDPSMKAQMMREIEILRSVDHPNVIKLVEVWEERSVLYVRHAQ